MTGVAQGAVNDDPRLGTVIADRYRILEKLGEGGMGAVYRAVHETLRKPVAVKLLGRAARNDRESVARFQREAVAAANLKHPNIAEATDSGQLPDGTLFLVMEYVAGKSLRALVSQGRLAPGRALHVLRQIGSAVSFAHQADVVHRDLKPENVVIFDRGEERDVVKVIDFGIARMRSSFGGGPSGLTQLGTVVGTLEYMSPEQAMGQTVDARADQYSLGVIAFELLTGKPPYEAEDAASLVYQHVGAPIPPVSDHARDLPRAVDAVVAKMMGKLPEERFATVSEAIAALAIALDPRAGTLEASTGPMSVQYGTPFPAPSALPPASVGYPPPPPTQATPATQATPMPATHNVTSSGTIISPDRPAAVPIAPGAPAAERSRRELPILLISIIVSVIGLSVVIGILISRVSAEETDDPMSASASTSSEAPPTLAPTSHDAPGKPKPKPKGRKKGKHD